MSKDQKQAPRERIEIDVEFDHEIPDAPKRLPERVCASEMPVRRYDAAVKVLDNEAKFIELALAKPEGWAGTLTPKSYAEVAEAAQEVNARFFAFCARRVALNETVGAGRQRA